MPMTAAEVLAELEAMGTTQNRKVYARHGVGREMDGVSYANLGKSSQLDAAQGQGDRCRRADRQGRGRSRRNQLQDPRRRALHRKDVGAEG